MTETSVTFLPELLYVDGQFRRRMALVCSTEGEILAVAPLPPELWEALGGEAQSIALPSRGVVMATRVVRLPRRALLPGLVNAHSHAFQRVIRGRTEYRTPRAAQDSFWTWREMMYEAATRLSPEGIYDASRMAFLEMAASGITSVGEFHYLHHAPDGRAYDDPNLLAKEVVRAARDVGLRIALLRVAYARAGFRQSANPRQARFIEAEADRYLRHVERLRSDLQAQASDEDVATKTAWTGVAPHSVRAVPLDYLREVSAYARAHALAVHMHVAEQRAEVSACLEEHGLAPVALLAEEGLLSERFTGVHAIHVTLEEVQSLARARAQVCACPTTERNLGDGIFPADMMLNASVSIALGTDSHTQIDLLEDARELEYHLRLRTEARNVLAPVETAETGGADASQRAQAGGDKGTTTSALAARLFACATTGGARSLSFAGGELAAGKAADFFTVDLDDPSIAGASEQDLLSSIVFSLARTAIREVAVGGRLIIEDGRHRSAAEIARRFGALQRTLWS